MGHQEYVGLPQKPLMLAIVRPLIHANECTSLEEIGNEPINI